MATQTMVGTANNIYLAVIAFAGIIWTKYRSCPLSLSAFLIYEKIVEEMEICCQKGRRRSGIYYFNYFLFDDHLEYF